MGLTPDMTPAATRQPAMANTAAVAQEQTAIPSQQMIEEPALSETQGSLESTAAPAATQPVGTPVLTQSSGALTVQLFSDADVEVDTPKYLVSGRAPAGTVLSINDEIILVDQNQAFSVWVPLEEGPNLVEIGASDDAGDEVDFMITVTYSSQQ